MTLQVNGTHFTGNFQEFIWERRNRASSNPWPGSAISCCDLRAAKCLLLKGKRNSPSSKTCSPSIKQDIQLDRSVRGGDKHKKGLLSLTFHVALARTTKQRREMPEEKGVQFPPSFIYFFVPSLLRTKELFHFPLIQPEQSQSEGTHSD